MVKISVYHLLFDARVLHYMCTAFFLYISMRLLKSVKYGSYLVLQCRRTMLDKTRDSYKKHFSYFVLAFAYVLPENQISL